MNDITKKPPTMPGTIPEELAQQMMAGIAKSPIQNVGTGGGKPFLRMAKDGSGFFYGPNAEEVQVGSMWAVNPMTFKHGRVCWLPGPKGAKGRKAGEVMASVAQPMPEDPGPIDGVPYQDQAAFELKCISGTDIGVEVVYVTPSNGGLQAAKTIMDAFQRHFVIDKAHPCPVITMTNTSYPHPSWGKIYKPIFELVGWCDMNGNMDGGDPAAVAAPAPHTNGGDTAEDPYDGEDDTPAPAQAQAQPRVKKPPLAVVPPNVNPAMAAPPQTGQRRRPSAQ